MLFSGPGSMCLAASRRSWTICSDVRPGAGILIRSLLSSSEPPIPHCQVLTSDKKTIVCLHPTKPTPFEESRVLRPRKPHLDNRSKRLTDEQVALVKKLRNEDGSLWSINTLAKLFNVKRVLISKIAPANSQRQQELDEEKEKVTAMRIYRRKIYETQKRMIKEKRLEAALAQNLYTFPSLEKDEQQKKKENGTTVAMPTTNQQQM